MNWKEKLFGKEPTNDTNAPAQLAHLRSRLPIIFGQLYFDWKKGGAEDFPLLYERQLSKVVLVDETTWDKPDNWFFIGDIHGDFFALFTILNEIKSQCPDFRIVFLGDIVDRGEQSIECIFLLLHWALCYPERIIWIAGNHDLAFSYDETTRQFSSSVNPSEFLDFLNVQDSLTGFRHQLGLFFMRLTENLPRAVLFPDGLLATHGGFPLVDLHEKAQVITTLDDYLSWLNSPECLQDFTWTRVNKNRKRLPNRTTKGCSYGYTDFEAFCALQPNLFPVKRMITGHEHPTSGWEVMENYQTNPAVTMTGFGFDAILESPFKFYNYKRKLIAGRYRLNELPEAIEIEYCESELRKLYPLPEVSIEISVPGQGDEISNASEAITISQSDSDFVETTEINSSAITESTPHIVSE